MMTAAETNFQKSLGSAFQDYCPQGSGPSISSMDANGKISPPTGSIPNYTKQDSPKESKYWQHEAPNGVVLTELDPEYRPAKRLKYEAVSPERNQVSQISSLTPMSSKYRRKAQVYTPTRTPAPKAASNSSPIEKATPRPVAKATKRTPKAVKDSDGKNTDVKCAIAIIKSLQSKDDIGRQDSSLLRLTRLFLEQNMTDSNGLLNLNDAAKKLNVQKRRLYDITNVLEGINMIERVCKNSVRWRHNNETENDAGKEELNSEIEHLKDQENRLDTLLQEVTSSLAILKEDPVDLPYSYLKFNDLRTAPSLEGNTIIAVKAPRHSISSIDVSDPFATGQFEMSIRNERNELSAYYISSDTADNPVEMGRDHAQQRDPNGFETLDDQNFDYKPLTTLSSQQDIAASPLLGVANNTLLTPTRQPSFCDWDNNYPDLGGSSGLHPQYLASPLKILMDGHQQMPTQHSQQMTELTNYVALEPAPDSAAYLYGMGENEFMTSSLYDHTTDW